MAITIDNITGPTSDPGTGDGTLTFAVTVNAGSNRLLVVAVGGRVVGKGVASVAFNTGEAFTRGPNLLGNTMFAEIWYLAAPSVTTANVVVTLTAGGVFVWDDAYAIVLDGVNQVTPLDSSASNTTGSDTVLSLSGLLTTVADNTFVIDAIAQNGGGMTMTPETNRVSRLSDSPSGWFGSSTILPKTPAGGVTMQWSTGAATAQTMVGAAFKPFIPSSSTGDGKQFIGEIQQIGLSSIFDSSMGVN